MGARHWRAAGSAAAREAFPDVAGGSVDGFESDRGERALLVAVAGLSTGGTGLPAGITHLVFVDPPQAAVAASLPALTGLDRETVLVAVPDDAGPVTIGSGRYRLVDEQGRQVPAWATPTGVPKLGEREDSLKARERWFGSRGGETG